MLTTLRLSQTSDYSTFEKLGNTGSVALPTALGMGLADSFFNEGTKVALLGIGSGLNSVMMGLELGRIAFQGS